MASDGAGEGVGALLDAVFERAGAALCLVGPGGDVLRANERWLRAARAARGEVIGRDVLAPFPRTWRVRSLLGRATRGETVGLPPLRRGAAAWHGTAAPVPLGGGAGALVTLVEAAEARGVVRSRGEAPSPRRALARGRAGEPMLRALADAMPQIVCVLAPDGTPEYVNPAWTAFSGLDLAASVERGWLGVVHPDDAPALRECWRRATATRAPEQVELRYRAAGGGWRWFLSRLAPIVERGRVARWIGAGIDIDDRRRAEAERDRQLASAEEADRRKTEFLAVLSHELRNPLAPLRSAGYILEHAPAGGAEARVAIGVIGRQVDHLERLVEDLLDVTRIARGKVQLKRRRVDVAELVVRTAEDRRRVLSARGIELSIAAPREPLYVLADRTRLAQVVGNLLANAEKFTDPGGRVGVSVARDGDRVALRVADTGAGIAPDLIARAFEPFVQAGDAHGGGRGGLGLGLALVKGLVELHGGTVEARSEGPGRGTDVTVRLPLAAVQEAEAPTPVPAPRAPARRVLVVEDNEDASQTLRLVLELEGHEVEVARDAAQALDRTLAFLPDVVLCDIGLPDRDGYALARELRSIPELAGVRLVALTGHALPEDQRRAADAGFDAHLGKPVSVGELERVLRTLGPPAGA